MARYRVSVYASQKHATTPTLLAIAGMLNTNVASLRIDTSGQVSGTVSFEIATMHDGVIEGIKRLDGVHAVLPIVHK